VSSDGPGDPATRLRILDAALRLVTRKGGADVKLADVAREARVSRQALYLHFADRAGLFLALVRHADERRGLAAAIQRIQDAASGEAALREMAATQARMNPAIWPLARALETGGRGIVQVTLEEIQRTVGKNAFGRGCSFGHGRQNYRRPAD